MPALTLESPRVAQAIDRIAKGAPRPTPRKKPAPPPVATSPPTATSRAAPQAPRRADARDLDAHDEVIATGGHLIERRAGRMTRSYREAWS